MNTPEEMPQEYSLGEFYDAIFSIAKMHFISVSKNSLIVPMELLISADNGTNRHLDLQTFANNLGKLSALGLIKIGEIAREGTDRMDYNITFYLNVGKGGVH